MRPPSHYPFMMDLQSPRAWGEVQARQPGGAMDQKGERSLEMQPEVVVPVKAQLTATLQTAHLSSRDQATVIISRSYPVTKELI